MIDTLIEKYLGLISNALTPNDVRHLITKAKSLDLNLIDIETIELAGASRLEELE